MNNDISRAFDTLPPEAQRQVRDFILYLQTRYKPAPKKDSTGSRKLADEAFVGIWRNRVDMKSGTLWVRETRNSEWGKTDE